MSADNVALPASGPAAARLLLIIRPPAVQQSIDISWPPAHNSSSGGRMGRRDGRKTRFIDPAPHYCADNLLYYVHTSLTHNALTLCGGRAWLQARPSSAPVLDICPLPGYTASVTDPRQGKRTRQLFSGTGGHAKGQMSASISHKYSTSSAGGRCLCL